MWHFLRDKIKSTREAVHLPANSRNVALAYPHEAAGDERTWSKMTSTVALGSTVPGLWILSQAHNF